MTTINRIGIASAFGIGVAVYGFLGLILGAICATVSLLGFSHLKEFGIPPAFGVLAIIVCPIVYGLIGGIGLTIAAAVYNLGSRLVGGLQVELGGAPAPQPQPEPQLVH